MKQFRIAVAGFQHETNTFTPNPTGFAEFQRADSWPELVTRDAVATRTRGMNLPIAGAIAEADASERVLLRPLLWCAAEPGGYVTHDAFDRIVQRICDEAIACGEVDGLYLDLHGAMVTETHNDGETAIIERVRACLGPDLPIAISLDFHANVSRPLVDLVDTLSIYRTYPHLDMAETGARAMSRLIQRLDGATSHRAFRQVPFLVPLHAQHTGSMPNLALYQSAQELAERPDEIIEIAMGFTASDVPDCGPSVVAYAGSQTRAATLAELMVARFTELEAQFETEMMSPAEAVQQALTMSGTGPVILADVQDNAGAGASSDTTGILHALISAKAPSALLGVICDAEVCVLAHQAGVGAEIQTALGGKSDLLGDPPVVGSFEVLRVSDGNIPYTGEMYGGGIAEVGPSCLLRWSAGSGDIRVVVSSDRTQCLDRALFTHFGVDPTDFDIVTVKSTVHFRADFEHGSRAILNVQATGAFPCALSDISYKNLRPGVRISC